MRHEKDFTIMWIPSHMNIVGYEKADTLAKEALQASLTHLSLTLKGIVGHQLYFDNYFSTYHFF